MRQMEDPPPAPERSRRRPPRSRTTEPVPLPTAQPRSRRGKTVKLQDVMKAYQRALIDAVESRLAAASEAAAEAARQAVAEALGERPRGPDQEDVGRGLMAYADERFQALSVRLQAIEDALRARPSSPDAPIPEDLAAGLRAMAETVSGLAAKHDALADEVTRRTGQGVVGVARVIRQDVENLASDVTDLGRRIEALEASVRSLHRTVAWEGMRTPRASGPTNAPNG